MPYHATSFHSMPCDAMMLRWRQLHKLKKRHATPLKCNPQPQQREHQSRAIQRDDWFGEQIYHAVHGTLQELWRTGSWDILSHLGTEFIFSYLLASSEPKRKKAMRESTSNLLIPTIPTNCERISMPCLVEASLWLSSNFQMSFHCTAHNFHYTWTNVKGMPTRWLALIYILHCIQYD